MSNPSNLYAEKVFAEHPLGLWALDDKLDYLTLISESQRDIDLGWSVTGGTSYSGSEIIGEPFKDSATTVLKGNVPSGPTNEIECISPDLVNFLDLNPDYGTFSVGAYVYIDSVYIKSISIGYEYTDSTSLIVYQKLKTFESEQSGSWVFVSDTFEVLDENSSIRAVIKIDTTSGGTIADDYVFYVNGISVGQWSEEFSTSSLGISTITIPSSISGYGAMNGVQASDYGIENSPGYYLVSNGLSARNTSLPLVYGASNVTKLNVSSDASLIVPGKGFLNNKGKYNDYTVEFWTRISSDSEIDKRIFGPISSTDGLYVNKGSITLAIGNNFGSYFVGEWYRPMLIQIRVTRDKASLLINGEQTISLIFDTESLLLPDELDINQKNQDWLGFYSYEDVSPFELDCIAIYPYQVPISVAKRRFVYGQGVASSESIDASYGGSSAYIDYPFAKYTANYSYPNFAKWQQGNFDNLVTSTTSLSTPQYSLPNIYMEEKSLINLYSDNKEIQTELSNFVTFRPNTSWNNKHTYFNFDSLNILNDEIFCLYGVFSSTDLDSSETLFKVYNGTNKNYLEVKKELNQIRYVLFYNNQEQELFLGNTILADEKYVAGIDIDKLIAYFGSNVAEFFGNRGKLKLYIAGDNSIENSFSGKVYSFGISTKVNKNSIQSYFDQDGIVIGSFSTELLNHTASYTLIATEKYNSYFLDINCNAYWEDYMPLSYFAKYVKDNNGVDYYDVDFLQFNIDYPAPYRLTESGQSSAWSYSQLKQRYFSPTQQTYSQLSNFLLNQWNDYSEMSQNIIKTYNYDTSKSNIKTYITFQYIKDGANKLDSFFTTIENINDKLVIDIDKYPNWETTKFEVLDNTIIYPSKKVDFSQLAISYRIEFNVNEIIKNPVSIKKLEISSQALNENSFNPIGTRYGQDMFPYKKSGLYFDYKSKNPFSIYKESSPYLYLTRKSGIKVRGDFDTQISRGISIPINSAKALNYKINAAQLWIRYDENVFPSTPTEIFQIKYKEDTIKFYIVSNNANGNRGRIFAKSEETNQDYFGASYYINGNLVRDPIITKDEWVVFGLAFPDSLIFDAYLGSINLVGSMLFNNVSYYQASSVQQIQKSINRPWIRVKNDGENDLNWQYWLDNYLWQGMLVLSTINLYGSNPTEIYKTYLGTNKIIIDDDKGMSFDAVNVKVHKDIFWQTEVQIPV